MDEQKHRGRQLTSEQKWQVFLEASRKNTTDVEVCRKWGITTWQLAGVRERVKDGSLQARKKGRGRNPKEPGRRLKVCGFIPISIVETRRIIADKA